MAEDKKSICSEDQKILITYQPWNEYEQQVCSLHTLRKIVEDTKSLPDDTMIFTQVVGTEPNSGAWNMRAAIVKSNNFKSGLILNISHHKLKRLNPEVIFDQ